VEVWANYVYLDTEERRRFAQKGHEYLIEQVQHTGGDTISSSSETSSSLVRLSFNHPVKELIWCYQNPSTSATANLNAMWNFSTGTANVNVTLSPLSVASSGAVQLPHVVGSPHLFSNTNTTFSGSALSANAYWIEEGDRSFTATTGYEVGPLHQFKLVLNGQDRFKEQLGKYFNQYQPFLYHTGCPYTGIYVYSFALQPEEHQPTGTCNFSRIDNAQVAVWLKTASATNAAYNLQKMFAVNYNILRIQSGMGGLAFSN
jgi:hypothetical protein